MDTNGRMDIWKYIQHATEFLCSKNEQTIPVHGTDESQKHTVEPRSETPKSAFYVISPT